MSAGVSFSEILFLILLPILQGGGDLDLLSSVDPEAALVVLGQKPDDASVIRWISGAPFEAAAPGGGGAGVDQKEVEKAIQNLASGVESVRAKARERLAAAGGIVKARLEEVVARDPKRAEEAKKVLLELEKASTSAGQKGGVGRLLAMRWAAEKKLASAVPELEAASRSTDPFVSRMAAEALAEISGKPATPTAPRKAVIPPGVDALPKSTRVLLEISPRGPPGSQPKKLRIDRSLREIMAKLAFGMPPEMVESQVAQVTGAVVQLGVDFGPFRIDSIHLANAGAVNQAGGGLAFILTGAYDPKQLASGFEKHSGLWVVSEQEGRKVYTSPIVRIIPLDLSTVLVLPQQASAHFPLAEYLGAVAGKKAPLRTDARWAKFLETLGGTSSIRGLAIADASLVGSLHQEIDGDGSLAQEVKDSIKALKELELDVVPTGDSKGRYRLEGVFTSPEHARTLTGYVKAKIQEGIGEIERMKAQTNIEALNLPLQVLKSVQLAADGQKGVLRMELDLAALLATIGGAAGVVPEGAVEEAIQDAEEDEDDE